MIKPVSLHFVTGKGGVGKSAVAAALALKLAKEGHRTLLVELGEESFYSRYFDLGPLSFQPKSLSEIFSGAPKLSVALWSGPQCLLDYALYLLKFEGLVKFFFENPISRALINVAPGLEELAILGKATSGPPRNVGPKLEFDRIVIDAYSSGHFMSLLQSPKALGDAIRFGPMGEQSRSIFEALCNSGLTQFHIVTLPEELPTTESLELAKGVLNLTQQKCHFILNRFQELPSLSDSKLSADQTKEPWFLSDLRKRQSEQEQSLSQLQLQENSLSEGLTILPKILSQEEKPLIESLATHIENAKKQQASANKNPAHKGDS